MSRVSDVDAAIIRQRLSTGERATDLADEYGVTKGCISLIQSGKRRIVPRPPPGKRSHTGYEGIHMITRDETLELPAEWTDEACYQLVMHAMELGRYGNPAGFLLVSSLHQFIGFDLGGHKYLKTNEEWNYRGIRAWLIDNKERALNVWRFQVQTLL